jgi:hypothetical protein
MRKTSLLLVASAAAVATLAHTTEAHALGPLSLEAGINVGYGSDPDSQDAFNPLGLGFGGRAGVSIFNFYGGIDGEYYLGGSTQIPITSTTSFKVSEHVVKYGLQVGYNLGIPFLTIRPQVGFGNLTATASSDAYTDPTSGLSIPSTSASNSSFYLEPGVVGIISLGMYFIGADANALFITGFKDANGNSSLKTSFTAHGQVGVTF